MASGHTDWQNLVNIALQALAEVIVRMKYGTPNRATYDDNVLAADTTSLVSIAGKGVIYGGYIHLHSGGADSNCVPILKLDGNLVSYGITLAFLQFYNFSQFGMLPFSIQEYDDTNCVYIVQLAPYMTFESSAEIQLYNPYEAVKAVTAQLTYALV